MNYQNKYHLLDEGLYDWLKGKAATFKKHAFGTEPFNVQDPIKKGQVNDFLSGQSIRPDFPLAGNEEGYGDYYGQNPRLAKEKKQRERNRYIGSTLSKKEIEEPWFRRTEPEELQPGEAAFSDKPIDMTRTQWKTRSAEARSEAQKKAAEKETEQWETPEGLPGLAKLKAASIWSPETSAGFHPGGTVASNPHQEPLDKPLFKLGNKGDEPIFPVTGSGPEGKPVPNVPTKHVSTKPILAPTPEIGKVMRSGTKLDPTSTSITTGLNPMKTHLGLKSHSDLIKKPKTFSKGQNISGLKANPFRVAASKQPASLENIQTMRAPLNEWEYLKYYIERMEKEDEKEKQPEDEVLAKRPLNEKPVPNHCDDRRVDPMIKGKPVLLGWSDY